jgi:hypothetical protein
MEQQDQTAFVNERLKFIEDSILKTRQNLKENSFFFLFWGWLIIATCLIHFGLIYLFEYEHHWIPWPILMTLGGITSGVVGYRMNKKANYKTHLDNFMLWMWSSCGILFFIVAFISIYQGILPIPFILAIAGAGTLATGGLIKYTPVAIGGIILFVAAIISGMAPITFQLPLLAGGFALGYLFPGYMLKFSK